ncbi:MAG: hypothetical protein M0Z27_04690 [Thermaerobacter sp.]|jgi:hypothetical protein|nr:hypothetical protein [Thermaerobacter sp.]MDA8145346.1 hypothetical protein [Thermaerobacter sp.]
MPLPETVEVRLTALQKRFLRELARQRKGRGGMSGAVRSLVEEAMRGGEPASERAAYRILACQWELYQASVLGEPPLTSQGEGAYNPP